MPRNAAGNADSSHLGGPLHPHDSACVQAEGIQRLRSPTAAHPPPVPHPHAAVRSACSRRRLTLAEEPTAWVAPEDQAHRSRWLRCCEDV